MTRISIFIPDIALRDAVVEQISTAKLGECELCTTADALAKTPNEIALVDGDTGAIPSPIAASVILMLGGADNDVAVTESFAKPLRLGHLITRLRYYLETAPLLRDQNVNFGPYRLEPQNRRIIKTGTDDVIRLTEKETALLVFLARAPTPPTRQDILAGVWGYDERIDTHTLETHIYQLRRKLDQESAGENWLINEAGTYRLVQGSVD